ncbi:MAG: hypothetical protein DME07_21100 [Candidatus Rokuibacteriota bacterium]|nr:MAG: hypothetical protein DME07_21100 [Candidatus Rokubacteria bacterium]
MAPRYSPESRKEKRALLEALERTSVGHAATLRRLHETLCFLQAHPDDAEVLALVDRALEAIPARVTRLGPGARRRLHDSGIASTTLDYPFGLPMARWLASRFPADADVAWRRFHDEDRLDETLSLLATTAEGDAFSEGGMGWREWLRVAKGGRRLTDLQLLLEVFGRTGLPTEARDWLFESLGLPIQWRPRGPGASRTLARGAPPRVFFHEAGLDRSAGDLVDALSRPLPALARAPRELAESLIDSARVAMATRQRELHAFSYPNPDDVLVVRGGRGLVLAFIGIAPDFRLPLEAYYGFLALKNGVPVSYGGGWELFGTLDFAVNIFASFRQGESAYLATQLLRAYRRIFGMRTVVVDRYQLGHESTEALRSGSFYFYHRLGFRPRNPDVLRVLETERTKIAADASYRSPVRVLEQLAGDEVFLSLPGGLPAPEKRLRATDVAALVARFVAREYGGDRVAAVRETAARVGLVLGVPRRASWPLSERRAFEGMSLVAALIEDLARWPVAARRALVAVMRAKGASSEMRYAHQLDGHRRLRRSLEALTSA